MQILFPFLGLRRPSIDAGLSILLLTLATSNLQAAGYFLPNQSTEATARGNAWVATANSPAAIHYNPAGLSQLDGPSMEGGIYAVRLGNKATVDLDLNRDGITSYEAKKEWQPIPHFFYAKPIDEKWSIGFGVYAPFGLGTEWGRPTDFQPVTLKAELLNLRGSLVASYRVNDQLSFGAGVALNFADGTLDQEVLGFPGSRFRFEGNDTAFTWIASAHYTPHPQHSFGLVYRSQADYNLDGEISTVPAGPAGSALLDFVTPATAAVGYAFKATDKLTVEANIEWIDFDSLGTLTLQADALPGGLMPIPFEWDSSYIWEIGLSYQIDDTYTFHTGYDYNESSQPDTFYNPAVADADRNWINLGITRETEAIDVHLAYSYGFSNRDVNGSFLGTNGKYEADHHALMISVHKDF